jgi:hypothetical protein
LSRTAVNGPWRTQPGQGEALGTARTLEWSDAPTGGSEHTAEAFMPAFGKLGVPQSVGRSGSRARLPDLHGRAPDQWARAADIAMGLRRLHGETRLPAGCHA